MALSTPLEATLRQLEFELQQVLRCDFSEEEKVKEEEHDLIRQRKLSLSVSNEEKFLDHLASFRVALRRSDASLALSLKDTHSSMSNNDENTPLEPDAKWLQHRFAENRALALAAEDLALRFREFTIRRRRKADKFKLTSFISGKPPSSSSSSSSSLDEKLRTAADNNNDNINNANEDIEHKEKVGSVDDSLNPSRGSSATLFDVGTTAVIRRRRREEEAATEAAERAELIKRLPKRDENSESVGSVDFLRRAVEEMQDNASRAISSTRLLSNDADAMRRTLQHHASLSGGMSEGADRVRAHKSKASRDKLVLYSALAVLVLVAAFLSARRLLWTFLGIELRIF